MNRTEVEGLDELEDILINQTRAVVKKLVRKAGNRAGNLFKAKIEENIERIGAVESGFLRDHIKVGTRVGDGFMDITIGPTEDKYPNGNRKEDRGAAEIAGFIEFGQRKVPANPFMRPAYVNNATEAANIFVEELTAGVNALGTT